MPPDHMLGYPTQFLCPTGSIAYRFFRPVKDKYMGRSGEEYGYWRYVFYVFNYLGDYASVLAVNHSGERLRDQLKHAVYKFPVEEKGDRVLTHTSLKEVISNFQSHYVINHMVQAGEMLHFYTRGLRDNGPWLFSETNIKIPGKGVYYRVGVFITRLFRRKPDTTQMPGGVSCRKIAELLRGEEEGYAVQGSSSQVYVLTNSPDTEYIRPRSVDVCVADDVEERAEGLAFAIYLSPKGELKGLPTIPVILHVESIHPDFLYKYLIHIAWHKLMHSVVKKGRREASLIEFEEVYNRLRERIRERLGHISDMFRGTPTRGQTLAETLLELSPRVFTWNRSKNVMRREVNVDILAGKVMRNYEFGEEIQVASLEHNIRHFKRVREELYGEYVLL
ncbi:hypothetical protein IG193_00625 [Infirmifilum lucidum]|uniref:Uncharacterized protein n=1 Tax=Infirmifilum lucidum TaxID=2776706 RepID=A0A7L9FJN8_9CREN|nr:hypothetical protein [Infirmifilum lucidum]QOJ79005.1 hypothetical protein IG193_00625 [Infirmifilum lucidum]